ncbi:MAG: MlaD family protein [Treponema sp.]|jgi:phospholipid/cholesterol/gamma-HCH transport system substrate-binding protein|nr:MlaD family protein [Treponema sp.]
MSVSRHVKVALFFILLGTAGTVYMFLSSDGFNAFNTRAYRVVLGDASGLSTRSKIYLAGIPVGRVRKIDLSGDEARLEVALLKDVEIRGDARLGRRSSSLLGTSVLTLNPGTELSSLVPEGGWIGAERNRGDMNAVLDMVGEVGVQITELLREFQNNQMQLLTVSLETFNSLARKIDAQSDAELERVSRILESTALITERTERLLANREDDIAGSITEIRAALENIRVITGEIRMGGGNFGQALYDDRLYTGFLSTVDKTGIAVEKLQLALDNFNVLAVNANGVVSDAGDIVSRANSLGIQVDTRAGYGLLSGRAQAGASLRLDPASGDRWYRVGVSTVPDGVRSRTIRETLGADGGLVSYRDTTETRYGAAIDAELARRFGPLTIRGGLLESTAGLGLDIQPVRWVSLSGEVFDFRTGEIPNLRGTLTVYPFFNPEGEKPWHWLYLRAGVNNILTDRRDYFIGGGVRFADREAKGLVGLIPVFGGN